MTYCGLSDRLSNNLLLIKFVNDSTTCLLYVVHDYGIYLNRIIYKLYLSNKLSYNNL